MLIMIFFFLTPLMFVLKKLILAQTTLNDNLKFSLKNKCDMDNLEEKIIVYVGKFLFNKNIERSRVFFLVFLLITN